MEHYYTFYDTNIFGDCDDELDITGEDYKELLKVCFEYCESFSFMLWGPDLRKIEESIPEELEEYRIEAEDNALNLYVRYSGYKDVRCYCACPETHGLILGMNDSIFSWINGWGHKKPEDIAFFREDGSIFMHCVNHDGECSLYPRSGEDIRSVLLKGRWYQLDQKNKYCRMVNIHKGRLCVKKKHMGRFYVLRKIAKKERRNDR